MEKSDNANDPEKVAENADVEVAEHLSRIDIEGATSLSGLRAIDDDAADEEELPDSAIEGTLLRLFFSSSLWGDTLRCCPNGCSN